MPRPGAVIEVDRNTPPVLFHFGEGVRLERLPLGARIVYPPDPLEPIAHAIDTGCSAAERRHADERCTGGL